VTLLLQFQTNAPKSCFMRPNSGVLAPKETLIATGNLLKQYIIFLEKFLPQFYITSEQTC